jgi:hypothetical protein
MWGTLYHSLPWPGCQAGGGGVTNRLLVKNSPELFHRQVGSREVGTFPY